MGTHRLQPHLRCLLLIMVSTPKVVELPLPRVSGLTKFHNPTRPSHLVGGALVRCRRSYSPSEIRSIRAMGLEQRPAYFSRRVKSISRTPDREDRARSLSQPRSTSSPGSFRSREHSRNRLMSPFQGSNQRVLPPRRRESKSPSIGGRSRSPSPSKRRCPKPVAAADENFASRALKIHMGHCVLYY